MSDNTATIVGNLTRTPVLRYTANSIPVTDLTVAVNHRRKDPMTEQWHDVACTYYTVTCWRTLAEHAVRTFEKGHRVIVIGRMYVEEWTGREGDVRQSIRIEPSSVGLDIRFSPAAVAPRPSVSQGPSVPQARDTDDAATRNANIGAVYAAVAEVARGRTTAEWLSMWKERRAAARVSEKPKSSAPSVR